MRNRLDIYRGLGQVTKGDIAHLRQNLAARRATVLALLALVPNVPLLDKLQQAAESGTHAEFVVAMWDINYYLDRN